MKLQRVLESLVTRIEEAEALDAVADRLSSITTKLLPGRLAVDLASGTAIGHPVHPLLVTVPIGSWSAAVVLDLTGQPEAAQRLIGLGVLTAAPTALTGLSDWHYTDGAERRVGLVHALFNVTAVSAYAGSWLARRAGHQVLGVLLSAVGGGAVSCGGWLGGHLSYALGVGVDTTAFQHPGDDWVSVVPEDQVRGGELTEGDANGVPLVLTRADGKIIALADRCTHRGGPLHEGELRDGCVVCPWHDSEFALDGGVVRGPAVRPQPSYEVEVRDGQVWARRASESRSLRTNPAGV